VIALLLLRSAFPARLAWLHAPWPYVLLLLVCALPAAIEARRSQQFERERWAASDYAPDES
jgi:hypothetical protein